MSEHEPGGESEQDLIARISGKIDAIINIALTGGGGAFGVVGVANGNHALFYATALMWAGLALKIIWYGTHSRGELEQFERHVDEMGRHVRRHGSD